MNDIVFIKLGGSLITDKKKEYTFHPDVVNRLGREIRESGVRTIIFHGSGSFGHTSAAKYGGKKGYKSTLGIATVARDAMEINRLVMDSLIKQEIPAVSLRPMSMFYAKEGEIEKGSFEIIPLVLRQGLVPVLYGDVIWDASWKSTIYSGESIANAILPFLQEKGFTISKIIQVGITDGIYDKEKKTIPNITRDSYRKIMENITDSEFTDVTGGMRHKVEEALSIAKFGVATTIINGAQEDNLLNALKGREVVGTVIE